MKHVLAIDQGTTGSTCLIFGEDGRVVGRGYREIPQHYPRSGWVEHDANDLLRCTVEAAREAIESSGEMPDAIGITNQRETVILWERGSGEPVGRASRSTMRSSGRTVARPRAARSWRRVAKRPTP